jgi:hypothetical protein
MSGGTSCWGLGWGSGAEGGGSTEREEGQGGEAGAGVHGEERPVVARAGDATHPPARHRPPVAAAAVVRDSWIRLFPSACVEFAEMAIRVRQGTWRRQRVAST